MSPSPKSLGILEKGSRRWQLGDHQHPMLSVFLNCVIYCFNNSFDFVVELLPTNNHLTAIAVCSPQILSPPPTATVLYINASCLGLVPILRDASVLITPFGSSLTDFPNIRATGARHYIGLDGSTWTFFRFQDILMPKNFGTTSTCNSHEISMSNHANVRAVQQPHPFVNYEAT